MATPVSNPSLSHHAVTRCVQRFMGVVVDVPEERFGSLFAMFCHLLAAGVTREQVESAILTPIVVAGLLAGATRITINGNTLISNGRGLVVTVHFFEDRRRQAQTFKVMGRRETQRASKASHRRMKRRPVWV